MVALAHLSDTHFGNTVQDPAGRAAAVMDHLLAMDPRPHLLVLSGDVADHGLPEEYAEARAWLDRWPGPALVCPGNHDIRSAYIVGLGRAPRTIAEVAGLRLVGLDSLIDPVGGERIDEGLLGDDQLTWLDGELAASRAPTLVVLHHPPTTLGIRLMDPIRLLDGDALTAVLERHPHVVATLVGHAHTMGATTFAGRPLLIGGGVVSTVSADAEPMAPVWYDAPLSFALHLLDGDPMRITTHWRSLPAR